MIINAKAASHFYFSSQSYPAENSNMISMNELTFCELRGKEIVNVADGKRLGRIIDLALTCNGRVLGFMAPGDKSAIKSLGGKDSVFIPWQNIAKIGDDVILVNLMVGSFPISS